MLHHPNVIYPPRQTHLIWLIEDLTEAAETGRPTRLRYAEGLKNYGSISNYMNRVRHTGRFSHGVSVNPEDLLVLKQSPDGEEPKSVRVTLREGAAIHSSGSVVDELNAMNQAVEHGEAPWPGGQSRVGALNWSKTYSFTDFRRSHGTVIYNPQEPHNG